MGNRPKYFEFVNTLRQSQLGEPARIRSIFHNETREKHEKQPKSIGHKERKERRETATEYLGGNSRKQRAPPILFALCLCASVRDVFGCCWLRDSEREGFDPPSRLRRIRFSRPARSATPPSLHSHRGQSSASPTNRQESFNAGGASGFKERFTVQRFTVPRLEEIRSKIPGRVSKRFRFSTAEP